MKIKSYAKLNLTLEIDGKNSNGYHKISGVFQNISLFDEIIIKESKNDLVTVDNKNISQSKNIAYKALKLLKNEMQIKNSFSVNIKKNIPLSSGLGGGSSNAAAIIKGLCYLYSIKPTHKDLISIATNLGADVPFFLNGGLQSASGIGENLIPLSGSINGTYLLVIPDCKIDTTWAYNKYKNFLDSTREALNFVDILKGDEIPFKLFENDFESIVIPAYPEIAEIKEQLRSTGPKFVSLSGSGSTVYGIFDDEVDAKSAESLFSHNYSTFIANPIMHM